MTEPLPFAEYARVVGRYLVAGPDLSSDPDTEPEGYPATGYIRLVPDVEYVSSDDVSSFMTAVGLSTYKLPIDDEGYLSYKGDRFADVVASDNPDSNPVFYSYTVRSFLWRPDGTQMVIPDYHVSLPAGETTNLLEAQSVEQTGGVFISRGIQGASAYEVAVENGFVGTEADWLDSLVEGAAALVPGLVDDAVDGHIPGSILGSWTRTSAFTTTSLSPTLLTGLQGVVIGQGRPVSISLMIPSVYHSVVGAAPLIAITTQRTGFATAYRQIVEPPSQITTKGDPCFIVAPAFVMGVGEEWTVWATVTAGAAGTATFGAAGTNPMYLEVVSR